METELYYLQSRYYDPNVGRFINADAFVSTGQGILGNNMFVYCMNNPVIFSDPSGYMLVHPGSGGPERARLLLGAYVGRKTIGEKLDEYATIFTEMLGEYATSVYESHMMQIESQQQVDQNSFRYAMDSTVAVYDAVSEGIDNMNKAEYQANQATHAFIADRFSTPEKTKNTLDGIGHAFTVAGTVTGFVSKASFVIGSVTMPLGAAITGVGTAFYIVSWMVSVSMEE